jgi:2-hydroxychromene-2-carboxylate isomerase
MQQIQDVRLFFNFRSPYCYLASKSMFSVFDDYHTRLLWRPLSGWDGRSAPDRAKVKIPSTRQDVGRWCRRLGIPFNPPPVTTDPTRAGAGSLLAEEAGRLREYIVEVMRQEWAEGRDIGDPQVLLDAGGAVGLDRGALADAIESPARRERLAANWAEAQALGVIGVPTFVIDDQIFWGNDRLDFVHEYLREKRLRRI